MQERSIQVEKQRAALMGLITSILQEEQELSLIEIKLRVANAIALMIDLDSMVADEIDFHTVGACKTFLEGEQALENVKDLLK